MKRFFALAMVVVLSTCASLLDSLRASVGSATGRTERFRNASPIRDAGPRACRHRRNGRPAPVEIISRRIRISGGFDGRDTMTASRRAA
jgi:hypothetical protein